MSTSYFSPIVARRREQTQFIQDLIIRRVGNDVETILNQWINTVDPNCALRRMDPSDASYRTVLSDGSLLPKSADVIWQVVRPAQNPVVRVQIEACLDTKLGDHVLWAKPNPSLERVLLVRFGGAINERIPPLGDRIYLTELLHRQTGWPVFLAEVMRTSNGGRKERKHVLAMLQQFTSGSKLTIVRSAWSMNQDDIWWMEYRWHMGLIST